MVLHDFYSLAAGGGTVRSLTTEHINENITLSVSKADVADNSLPWPDAKSWNRPICGLYFPSGNWIHQNIFLHHSFIICSSDRFEL